MRRAIIQLLMILVTKDRRLRASPPSAGGPVVASGSQSSFAARCVAVSPVHPVSGWFGHDPPVYGDAPSTAIRRCPMATQRSRGLRLILVAALLLGVPLAVRDRAPRRPPTSLATRIRPPAPTT